MAEILLFGGTTEGRALAEALKAKCIPTLVCVATEYGESLLTPSEALQVHTGRLDAPAMAALIAHHRPRLVIDGTHPYAADATDNIRAACGQAGLQYLRVRREAAAPENCEAFASMEELVAWLSLQPGVIFSTLGTKEAAALAQVTGFSERVWLRILPAAENISACANAGFPPKRIICMQGPFSTALNLAMFEAASADILVTKESGATGGFPEKLEAAKRRGMKVAVLTRPREESGCTLAELIKRIQDGAL